MFTVSGALKLNPNFSLSNRFAPATAQPTEAKHRNAARARIESVSLLFIVFIGLHLLSVD